MRNYVVVPNWNGKELLGPCLNSLLNQSIPAEIIVVDNGSQDSSVEYIHENFPKVQIVPLRTNTGFAGGVNKGIQAALEAGAEAIALFNNDAVADKDWLKNLDRHLASKPDTAIVTSKLLLMDKEHLDSTGDFYTTWGLPFPRGRNEKDTGQYDAETEVFSASGGASLYRAKMFQEVGVFDESFFAYFEDVDISFRARLAGWKVYFEPRAIAYHHLNATSSRLGNFSLYHSSKNFILLYTKNMPLPLYIKYFPLFTAQLLRWFLTSLLRGKILAYLKGVSMALLLLPGTLVKRIHIQHHRKLTIQELDKQLVHNRPPTPKKLEAA